MNNLLKLNGSIGPDDEDDNQPDDIRHMQSALTEIGRTPFRRGFREGESPVNEIERLQVDRDLQIDGRARPGGPTQRSINNELLRKRDEDRRTLGGFLSDPRVDKPVGFGEVGKSNTVRDIARTEDALTRIGFPPRNEAMPTDLMRASAIGRSLMDVQTEAGLEGDGLMTPGGPTEREVMRRLAEKKQLAKAATGAERTKSVEHGRRQNMTSSVQVAEGLALGGGTPPAIPQPNPTPRVHAPTRNKIRPKVLQKALGFDPKGIGTMATGFELPLAVPRVLAAEGRARESTRNRFPTLLAANNQADAFQHALWSFLMTKDLGPHVAKKFGDANEISSVNTPGGRLMDLYNNNVGRRLAMDPKNKNKPPEKVILDALANGQLQTRPFRTR